MRTRNKENGRHHFELESLECMLIHIKGLQNEYCGAHLKKLDDPSKQAEARSQRDIET